MDVKDILSQIITLAKQGLEEQLKKVKDGINKKR